MKNTMEELLEETFFNEGLRLRKIVPCQLQRPHSKNAHSVNTGP